MTTKTNLISENYLELTPAYGRDYKNAALAKAAFMNGSDFILASVGFRGTYCSVRDFEPGTKVNIRYAKLAKVVVVSA